MLYTDEAEYKALLAACVAAPADDTPRLMLADWLADYPRRTDVIQDREFVIRSQIWQRREGDCGHRVGVKVERGRRHYAADCKYCSQLQACDALIGKWKGEWAPPPARVQRVRRNHTTQPRRIIRHDDSGRSPYLDETVAEMDRRLEVMRRLVSGSHGPKNPGAIGFQWVRGFPDTIAGHGLDIMGALPFIEPHTPVANVMMLSLPPVVIERRWPGGKFAARLLHQSGVWLEFDYAAIGKVNPDASDRSIVRRLFAQGRPETKVAFKSVEDQPTLDEQILAANQIAASWLDGAYPDVLFEGEWVDVTN